jgi:hypothetical protein
MHVEEGTQLPVYLDYTWSSRYLGSTRRTSGACNRLACAHNFPLSVALKRILRVSKQVRFPSKQSLPSPFTIAECPSFSSVHPAFTCISLFNHRHIPVSLSSQATLRTHVHTLTQPSSALSHVSSISSRSRPNSFHPPRPLNLYPRHNPLRRPSYPYPSHQGRFQPPRAPTAFILVLPYLPPPRPPLRQHIRLLILSHSHPLSQRLLDRCSRQSPVPQRCVGAVQSRCWEVRT